MFHSPCSMRQPFSQRVVRNLKLTASFHVLFHSVCKKCPALSPWLRSRPACPVRHLHPGSRPSMCPLQHPRRYPHSCSLSIHVFATKSSPRQYFSAGASSLESGVSISTLFFVAGSGQSISTSVIPSIIGGVPLNFFVASATLESEFSLGIDVSGSPESNCHFRRPSQSSVLAESRAPSCQLTMIHQLDASHPPASSVNLGGVPRRTKPCPSHGNPLTSFSKETSVRSFGGSLGTVRAICRAVSATMMCALSSSSRRSRRLCPNRCHPRKSFCFGSGVWCEAKGYGVGPVHQTGESERYTRCRTRLDTAWLHVFPL